MKAQPASDIWTAPEVSSRASRRQRITAFAAFVALVCCGVTSCTRTQVALSSAAIAAVLVGTTVGVTLAIQHQHHTLQGCVSSDADVLKLRTSDGKIYTLKGDAAGIKVGDRAKLHGAKAKRAKGGDQVFVVEKVNRDYGPCPNVATSSSPAR